ncbi:major facilitator superfamily domain-containing protein [Chlamydoabsidia padenii]|nr:major facilitator superfamily domain-containing protein [Chlamydoabsidia padenii]
MSEENEIHRLNMSQSVTDHNSEEKPNKDDIELSDNDEKKMEATILRSNIGNAKLGGLEQDLGLTPQEYQWSLSIFYFGYVIFDLPSNIVMRRWRPSIWLGVLILWGVTAVAMCGVTNFAGLATARVFLGIFEAGAFGGLIAYGITQIPTDHLQTWQLLFLIEGTPSIVLALLAAWLLPNSPETATFLTKDERHLAIKRLAKDAGAANDHSWSWAQVNSVFSDWKAWAYAIIYLTGTSALQGVTLFLPSIISGMGTWNKAQSQALTTPPYFVAFVATLIAGWSSDKLFDRALHMVTLNLIGITGFLLMMFVDHSNTAIHYFAACLVTLSVYANVAVKIAWFNNNFAGLTRKAVGSAFIVSIGTIGGAVGGQIYYDPPDYFYGNLIAVCLVGTQTILVIIVRSALDYENKRRDKLTEEMKEYEIYKYGGIELAGDRHPNYRYVL